MSYKIQPVRRRKPTDAELAILRVLWSRGPSTVREVAEAMGREGAYTTVLKLMQIMTDKGLVKRDDSSRTHVYKAAVVRRSDAAAAGHRSARQGLRRIGRQARAAGARRWKGVVRGAGRDPQAARRASWRWPMNPWIDVAGWTLVHFLWEGAGIARDRAGRCSGCFAIDRRRRDTPSPARRWSRCWRRHWSPPPCCHVRSRRRRPGALAAIADARARQPLASPDPRSRTTRRGDRRRRLATRRASMSQPAAPRAWLPLVVMLWIAGVARAARYGSPAAGGASLGFIARHARPRRRAWTDAAARIAATLGLSRRVHVVDTSLVDTPTVIGWVRPVILLPIAAFAGLSPSQVEAILAHELAHIRRHDFLVNLLQTFAETILFYHPAVWWLSARIRTEREHCCDVVALSVCGDAVSYAEALVELESWRTVHSRLAVAATGGTLLTRVRRLLGAPADDAPRSFGAHGHCRRRGARRSAWPARRTTSLAAQPDDAAAPQVAGDASDPAAWSMVFNHDDSTMRFIGFRGRDLIRFAYQIPEARVIGGPRWLDEQILQIVVNLDAAPRADEMPGIVRAGARRQAAAEDAHREAQLPGARAGHGASKTARSGPSSAWRAGRASTCSNGSPRGSLGTSCRRVAARAAVRRRAGQPVGLDAVRVDHDAAVRARNCATTCAAGCSTPRAASTEPARLGPNLVALKAPDIVDRTGLRGRYDVEFSAFYPTAALMTRFPFLTNVFEPIGFTSIPRALDDQLGLKLVESEAPYDVIVIDQAERP